jgi:hypothetical protein
MRPLALTLAALLPFTASAQVMCALGPSSTYRPSEDSRPSPDALELAARANAGVKAVCGTNCPEVVLFRNPTAAGLMLIVDGGRAKVVYAPQTFTAAYDRHGDAGILALMSHALGHALDDVLGAAWIQKSWTAELRADAWAGCILARSSLPAAEIQEAWAALAENPAPLHPAWSLRLPAIRTGFMQCGGTAAVDVRGAKK